jgi:hypothetical protein
MAFAVIFIARGVMNIGKYLSGDLGRSDFAVSVSDIVVSLVWLACGILFLADKRFGNGNIVPVLFQSSLLYIGLIIYLIVTPIVYREAFDWGGIVVIVIMSLFFITPLFLTAGKVRLLRRNEGAADWSLQVSDAAARKGIKHGKRGARVQAAA